ncbi:MAG: DNA-binding NarL/FixJ family response regulator [Arenicella sp.]|jgi:DNA-binding NarL/FixJ family response regulator
MPNKVVQIGIAEDQTLFRQGLIQILNGLDNIEVVLEAVNGQEFLDRLKKQKIDIAFLDYKMPILNGAKTAKLISKKYPNIKILFISMYNEEEFIVSAIENGANGYITKDESVDEIELAIESLMSIGYYMNDRTSKLLLGSLLSNASLSPKFKKGGDKLTELEILVMKLICQEYSTREIAEMIFRGVRTVEGIRSNILKKTGAKNSNGIVMYAVKKGIVDF